MCIVLIGLVSSAQESLGTFEQDEDINLIQMCDGCTSLTISAVTYPNGTIAISSVSMSSTDNYYYNYTLDSAYTNPLGKYTVNGYDNGGEVFSYDIEVTENGWDKPSENIIISYSILFFLVLSLLLFTIYSNIVHLASNDTDLRDIAYSLGAFILLLVYYYFANIYFPKVFVMDILQILLSVTGFTHIFVPMTSFIFATIQRGKME